MNRDALRARNFKPRAAITGRLGLKRIAAICLVALFTTGFWWLILYFGGHAFGYPLGYSLLLPVLAGIFLLLVLGLSMSAVATSRAPDAPRGVHTATAEPPQRRREAG